MKVSVYSRAETEKMIADGSFPKNTAVISFYDSKIKHIDSDYDCVDYYGYADEVFYSELDDLDIGYLTKNDSHMMSIFRKLMNLLSISILYTIKVWI
ncbi:MAG: hypothetical protein K2J47_05295 [Ruminococcus sp.]|nr:hypothetical protein [Ruminococcus sp.]